MPETPSHGDLRDLITRLDERMTHGFESIHQSIGHPSDDGKGGSGLWGELRRTQAIVDNQNSLLSAGRGFLIAITLSAGTIFVALKIGAANAVAALARALST